MSRTGTLLKKISDLKKKLHERQASKTWPHVMKFAELMEAKLAQNRHKGDREGWIECELDFLVDRLREEVAELDKALLKDELSVSDVKRECADVANFAMMVADVVEEQES